MISALYGKKISTLHITVVHYTPSDCCTCGSGDVSCKSVFAEGASEDRREIRARISTCASPREREFQLAVSRMKQKRAKANEKKKTTKASSRRPALRYEDLSCGLQTILSIRRRSRYAKGQHGYLAVPAFVWRD